MDKLIGLLKTELGCWESSWSIGSFGAIGEFHQDLGEALIVNDRDVLTRATARGAIRIVERSDIVPVAYELLSPRPHRWSQGVALCLTHEKALRTQRSVLTEIGPDTDALRPSDRDEILFDVGLAQPQVDFCVRTRDPDLLAILRVCCGKPTFATEAGSAILGAHPHRIVISNLGRAEVYQKIGGPETCGVSPAGPHTHVLPKLLAARRTHSSNTPIPDGLVPCAFLYPANPVITTLGEDKPFDATQFDRFQSYLDRYGPAPYVRVKKAVWAAIDAGQEPTSMVQPDSRLERVALRNALRQMSRLTEAIQDAQRADLVDAWRVLFDKSEVADESEIA